ncbi:MAG: hypothetical protein V3S25_05955 [Nitrospirales bacterium]|jgi:hypothetical protein
MSKTRARRAVLRKVPEIKEGQDSEWLGFEAHVRPQARPFDWRGFIRRGAAGFNGVALGLAFLGGLALGGTLATLISRIERN